ncbi:MAG: MG2 domain-containing protein [Sandaracinaceae bacterium]
MYGRRWTSGACAAVALAIATSAHSSAHAQSADPVAAGSSVGYELALSGATRGETGHALRLTGVGYEVSGLGSLSARRGLVLDAEITERRSQSPTYAVVTRASARTEADGTFELAIDVPTAALSAPRLELTLHREGQPGRRFVFPLAPFSDETVDLLTDRNRYQPGEAVRIWTRVRAHRDPRPRAGRQLQLRLLDPRGEPLQDRRVTTGASGAISAELELPDAAEPGSYTVLAEPIEPGGPTASRSIQVWRRTVERVQAEVRLEGADEDGVALLRPGGPLRGRVRVTTPSGTPIRGATVEVTPRADAEPTTLSTDANGDARFDLRAPSFLAGEVSREQLIARATHAAYGTIATSASYVLSRTPAVVSLSAEGGALVPEAESTLFVSVSDPRGRPLPGGTEVVVRGLGVAGSEARVTIDDKGFAEVPVTLPRAAASTMRGGPCAGRVASSFEIEVQTTPPRTTRSCVGVSADAELALGGPAVPLVAPGDAIELAVRRRPSVRGRPVLVEALYAGRAVASAWASGGRDRVRLTLPPDALGVIVLRARAMRDEGAREPGEMPGAALFGVGAFGAVLVRPPDFFELTVHPAHERYLVRERASVELGASPSRDGWAALLVRDQAAHGGEGPWDLHWVSGTLEEAARAPADAVNARFLRASLSGSASLDQAPIVPAPIEAPYWRRYPNTSQYGPGMQTSRGVLRDPVALREELVRRGITRYEVLLEHIVRGLAPDAAARAPYVVEAGGRVRFHRDVIAHLVANRQLTSDAALTLGGQPITVQMIEDADPGFDFDTVAKRVARERLARLLLALLRLTDPDQPGAQRASANLPPERWLGTVVQLGLIGAADLVDPWGHPFVFRRVARPRIAISERALDWELASPGPDGRLGSADDVNDPFARAVPAGTPYAVASGEENAMRAMSTLAPATTVLSRMTQAYQRLSLAASEEQTATAVSASSTEVDESTVRFAEQPAPEPAAMEMLDAVGGGGLGSGRGRRAAPPRSVSQSGGEYADRDADGILDSDDRYEMEDAPAEERRQSQSRADAMGALIREDFPATLFFVGEVPLDGGRAAIEVPLADALTTYRLEAIAWTPGGWSTSAMARLSVDQEALIDAPVPEVATAGDRLRLPVRVENRTDAPLALRIGVTFEGLAASAPAPVSIELEPRAARVTVVELTGLTPGEGHAVVSLTRASGEAIDAVRRPIRVLADARTARERRSLLVEGQRSVRIDVPAQASARGPGLIRVATGVHLFGELTDGDPLWAGWALRMAGEPLDDTIAETVLARIDYDDDNRDELRDGLESALALAGAWRDRRLTDADAERALRSVAAELPAPEALRGRIEDYGDRPSWLLLALAPIARDAAHRPAVAADLRATVQRLGQLVAVHGARAEEAPAEWAHVAAALALSGQSMDRAHEMLRRCERYIVAVGDMAWLDVDDASDLGAVRPTGFLALAQGALGEREAALRSVRALVHFHRAASPPEPIWTDRLDILPAPFPHVHRALAAAAAARLARGPAPSAVTVRLDGRTVAVSPEGATWLGELAGIGTPGAHELVVSVGDGAVALVRTAYAYGLPWDLAPRRDAQIALTLDGEIGARDTRSGLRLSVQNRGPRLLTEPVVEIELPAGAELDEPTRELLAQHLRSDAHMEGRTLILPLRPLAPAGWARIPIPARWALSGAVHGLGAVAYDARGPEIADVLPVSVLPARVLNLEDEGPEPERPDAEASAPEPVPVPLPILEPLAPWRAAR